MAIPTQVGIGLMTWQATVGSEHVIGYLCWRTMMIARIMVNAGNRLSLLVLLYCQEVGIGDRALFCVGVYERIFVNIRRTEFWLARLSRRTANLLVFVLVFFWVLAVLFDEHVDVLVQVQTALTG